MPAWSKCWRVFAHARVPGGLLRGRGKRPAGPAPHGVRRRGARRDVAWDRRARRLCRRMRAFSQVPIVMLTARAMTWTASWGSRSARTIICPSPSTRVSCWRAWLRFCVARARRAPGHRPAARGTARDRSRGPRGSRARPAARTDRPAVPTVCCCWRSGPGGCRRASNSWTRSKAKNGQRGIAALTCTFRASVRPSTMIRDILVWCRRCAGRATSWRCCRQEPTRASHEPAPLSQAVPDVSSPSPCSLCW